LHTLELQTSLCFAPDELITRVPPARLRLAATFHPSKETAENFITKVEKLRNAGFDIYCNFLAHPDQLQQLERLRAQFSAKNLPLYAQAYQGPHSGGNYPSGYSETELALIENRPPGKGKTAPAAAQQTAAPAQRLCRMGQMYAKILPDGRAWRCRTVAYEKNASTPFYLGNFFNAQFSLLPEALPCSLECQCEPMLAGAEGPWITRAGENRKTAVSLGWDLCYDCNYRCPYCQGWSRTKKELRRTLPEWNAIWRSINMRYGPCHIFVSGGEPSLYPDFVTLMLQTAELHEIDICTNLSWDPELLTSKLSPRNLSISATFHPDFADFEEFLAKAVKAKDYLAHGKIYTVGAPSQLDKLQARAEACARHGIKLQVMPLRGPMQAPPCAPAEDGAGPAGAAPSVGVLNDARQKEKIQELAPAPEREAGFRLGKENPKGRLCRAGCCYAIIRADGSVDRCSQYETGELGRIDDKDFRLYDSPRPCGKEFCPIESDWLQ
ncbi:MAG TPA: radical SAM protein, partial [Elusimicrobiales bacterium]|nr:radical SAM protein [Elusimicrobiales bacterium]